MVSYFGTRFHVESGHSDFGYSSLGLQKIRHLQRSFPFGSVTDLVPFIILQHLIKENLVGSWLSSSGWPWLLRFHRLQLRNLEYSFNFPFGLRSYPFTELFCFSASSFFFQRDFRCFWGYLQCPTEMAVRNLGQPQGDRCRFNNSFTYWLKVY